MIKFKKDIFTKKELWERANGGDVSVLKDKNVSLLKDSNENTPLHWLAEAGKIEVLNHPEVTTVKNNYGSTPLHYLAMAGRIEILDHPDVATLKNNGGYTPLHYLVTNTKVPRKYIKKLFPWYPLKKNEKIDENLITKILKTPNSVRFIYE